MNEQHCIKWGSKASHFSEIPLILSFGVKCQLLQCPLEQVCIVSLLTKWRLEHARVDHF